jgi:3-carboxy-cis,cis-muconate cycloisomerase
MPTSTSGHDRPIGNPLEPVATFEHPFLGELLGDPETADLLSAEVELALMLRFEAELALAQAAHGLVPSDAARAIAALCASFRPDLASLRASTARDGVVVPELVRQLKAALGPPHASWIHLGTSSQDVIDTSLVLRLDRVTILLDGRLATIVTTLDGLARAWGDRRLMGRTRMRRALPIAWAHKLASWREPLLRDRRRLAELRPRLLRLQLGGATGDRAELGPEAHRIADRLADALRIGRAERAWNAERDAIAELAGWLALVAGSLGKLGQDVALLAQDEVAELVIEGGGGSSAMPHKVNPVAAETLVALARHAATLAPALQHGLVHENERSGAAWTLEWLSLPQLLLTVGAATRTALRLLGQLGLPEARVGERG